MDAREALKNKFAKRGSVKTPVKDANVNNSSPTPNEGKEMRSWVTFKDKISKKDMD